jgi:site-specific recombinase XerD
LRLVLSGVPLAVVTRLAGHSDIQITMIYAHTQPENNAQAVAAMMSFYPKTKIK